MTSRSLRRLALLVALWISLLAALPVYAASPSDYDTARPANLIEDYLYGESAIAVDADTGRVLFSKNSRVRMYPASTTKMMTMLLAVESGYDLDTQVTLPAETNNYPQDSSRAGVYKGDTMTFRDLLYGMMLPSGNDAANAVAVLLGGSVENFVQQMNDRAQALGTTAPRRISRSSPASCSNTTRRARSSPRRPTRSSSCATGRKSICPSPTAIVCSAKALPITSPIVSVSKPAPTAGPENASSARRRRMA